jgi:hypothetical protein
MEFMRSRYGKDYAANTRETIRRQTIHQFEQARLIDRNPDDPNRPTNSGKTVYVLTERAAHILRCYGTKEFAVGVASFAEDFGSLQDEYNRTRRRHTIPLKLPGGSTVYLSPGSHNKLQVAVVEEFGPRFAPGSTVLYVGDTSQKDVVFNSRGLVSLGIPITQHDKLPDIILYWQEQNWLFLVEAVTSHGPVSPKRHREMEAILGGCSADRIYVTAFLRMRDFRKYAADIAWETEVWIEEDPDHMIHFNGPKFLGPYGPR